MDLQIPDIFSNEGMIAILFTVIAAIVTAALEKRKKTKNAHEPTLLIQKTFEQIDHMMEDLREQNENLREKYDKQIEINNKQGEQISKLSLQITSFLEDLP